jgi:uncharacterized protein involved in exopolysaccharide biosynthesis
VRPIPNTTLIDIEVSGENASEAAEIANAIAGEYRNQQTDRYSDSSRFGIAALEKAFETQHRRIEQQRANVDQLAQQLGVGDEGYQTPVTSERQLSQLRIEKETQLMTEVALRAALTNLSQDKLIEVLPTAAPDPLLNALITQLNLAQQHLVALSKDYGPNHPECLKVGEQIADLKKKINDRTEGIMLGLSYRIDSLQEGLRKLQEEVNNTTQAEAERKRKLAPYTEARRRLEELERFGQALSLKIAAEKIDGLQSRSMPRIVETAVPIQASGTPPPHALLLIGFGLLLDALGFCLIRLGRG